MQSFRLLLFYGGYYLIIALWVLAMLCISVWFPLRHRGFFCFIFYRLYEAWLGLCLNIRVDYDYESALSGNENYIVAANHQTEWEAFALTSIWRPSVTVLKEELMRLPFFGWSMALLHPIALRREHPVESIRKLHERGRAHLRQGYNLVIFPQGTRVPPPNLGRFSLGPVKMALETGKSLLLIAHNSGRHMPRGFSGGTAGVIYVKIAAPISPLGHTKDSLSRQLIGTMERMMTEVHMAKECKSSG